MHLYVTILNEDQTHRISGPISNKYIILHCFACILKKYGAHIIFFLFWEKRACQRYVILISYKVFINTLALWKLNRQW